ncbi:MAG: histidine kinase, partial [Chloroflexaceae bacterium]|nr:histidine kinase [Chloroflexaceae bacterium]
MKAADLNLRDMLQFNPEQGRITFGADNRMVLVGAELMGSLVDGLIDVGDVTTARVLLRRCGKEAGHRLARLFKEEFNPENQQEWLAFGPTMHAWEGAGKPNLAAFEFDPATNHFLLEVHFENSYFADQYLATT